MSDKKQGGLSSEEKDEAVEIMGLRSPQIYEVVRKEGVEELSRPWSSLFWSGIAAGIALSLSIYCKAFLYSALEGHSLQTVISNAGYTVGFVIVILGRLQLFTENTVTAVLPVLGDRSLNCLKQMMQLWAIVFVANMLGSLVSSFCAYYGSILPSEQIAAVLAISHHLVNYSPMETFLHGVPAGFMVASIVWLMPSSKGSEFLVIFLITYMIALGGMTHVVAGSTEWFMLAFNGGLSWSAALFKGILPALLGNILGGTGLFALISYGQVKDEI